MSFNEGDVVQLKSGGPKMTVTGVVGQDPDLDVLRISGFGDGDVTVTYFDSANRLVRETFKKITLDLCTR
jgi:uncharacterized protein YodC (DUF2158 family)